MKSRRPGARRAYQDQPREQSAEISDGFTATTATAGSPHPVLVSIDPSTAGTAHGPAADLCAAWVRKHNGGSAHSAREDRQELNRFFGVLAEACVRSWDDVTVALLERVEDHFAQTAYTLYWIWYCLRTLPSDSAHGTLGKDVRTFVQSPPGIGRLQSTPTEALPADMLRDILRAAMSDVSQAEHRILSAGWAGHGLPPKAALVTRREVTAFYVLLCFEWGLSPDVIKALSFDPQQPTSVQDWGDGRPTVKARWLKNRGGRRDTAVLMADKEWRAGALLRRLRDATAATRSVLPDSWRHFPWVYAEPVPTAAFAERRWWTHTRYRSPRATDQCLQYPDGSEMWLDSAFAGRYSFKAWCAEARKPGLQVAVHEQYVRANKPIRLTYRAIRPAAKWAKYEATGKGRLLSELADDNTVEVLAAHYLNSEIAMRDIGEAWMEIPGLAEEVARGLRPTVLDRNGTVVSGEPITSSEASQALGDNRVGSSGCRDPYNPPIPGEAQGSLCGAANRSCYFCPNSVVTPDDIPVMKAYLRLAEKATLSMSPPEWQLHWGRTVRWICSVMPLMASDWEDIPVGGAEVFDLALEAGPA